MIILIINQIIICSIIIDNNYHSHPPFGRAFPSYLDTKFHYSEIWLMQSRTGECDGQYILALRRPFSLKTSFWSKLMEKFGLSQIWFRYQISKRLKETSSSVHFTSFILHMLASSKLRADCKLEIEKFNFVGISYSKILIGKDIDAADPRTFCTNLSHC